jgi:hypothetical protein
MIARNCFLLMMPLLTGCPVSLLSQSSSPAAKGFYRTQRINGNWDWGTGGHGSFENAMKLFAKEKEVAIYNQGKVIYRVFTSTNNNYIEINYGWDGGKYTYTTKVELTPEMDVAIKKDGINLSIINDDNLYNKVVRKDENWSWGTYDHGSFDQAAKILKETDSIITFTDPNGIWKYRVFSHGGLNYVEIDYGCKLGIFTYTTNR